MADKDLEEMRREYFFDSERMFEEAGLNHMRGVPPIKEDVEDYIEFINDYEKYEEADARLSPGVFLYGKPGTGKTLTARIWATETDSKLIYAGNFPRPESKWSYSDVNALFDLAEEYYRETGELVIIYFDEIDALCSKSQFQARRTDASSALMSRLDGISGKMKGILVVGATNKPDQVDKALVRPGRLGYQIAYQPPGLEGKKDILEYYLDKKPHEDIDTTSFIHIFPPKATPAGIEELVETAYRYACLEDGDDPEISEDNILDHAIENVLGSPSGVWIEGNERWLRCVHEAGIAIVGDRVTDKDKMGLARLVVVPETGYTRGKHLISFKHDRFAVPVEEVEDKVTTLYGGQIAEKIVNNERYLGGEEDVHKATRLSLKIASKFSEDNNYFDMCNQDGEEGEGFLAEIPEKERSEIFAKAKEIREECREEAREILESFGEEGISKLADQIEEEEFMLGKEIRGQVNDIKPTAGEVYEKDNW